MSCERRSQHLVMALDPVNLVASPAATHVKYRVAR
jgi:hypothetical protein